MTTTQPEAQPSTPARPGRDGQAAAPVVAFLGTGRMGGPMAANLARGGLGVRVWNRTSSRAEALAADGPATERAATGPDGFLAAAPGVTWVQMGTIGIEWTARLADIAAARGVVF